MDEKDAKKRIEISAKDFMRLVLPHLIDWIGGDEILSIESMMNYRHLKLFDEYAGIDAIQIKTSEGIRGIASRVQYGWRDDYRSFTSRFKTGRGSFWTEFEKRKKAIESSSGLFYPFWTSQAYITKPLTGNLLYLCLIKTIDLYEFMNSGFIENRINKENGAEFKVAWVKDLKKAGYLIHFYENTFEIGKLTGQALLCEEIL